MDKRIHILYVQHADSLGGSVVSLRELIIDALAYGHRCTVVCPNDSVAACYRDIGADTTTCVIPRLNHNTAYYYKLTLLDLLKFSNTIFKTVVSFIKFLTIVKRTKPSLAHLNSSTLVLYNIYFRLLRIPTVFHVRENVVYGYFGIRRNLIRLIANYTASAIIYISDFEFKLLKTKASKSFVVYNYVHEADFIARSYETPLDFAKSEKLTFITIGGLYEIKGGRTLLEALSKLDNTELIVLGSDDPRNNNDLSKTDGAVYRNEILNLLDNKKISSQLRFFGKVNNPAPYIKEADVLVFWANAPHFPRPVFEAWLLKKPVIYFNPLFENANINKKNAFIIKKNSPSELAQALTNIRNTEYWNKDIKEKNYLLAKLNFTETNFEKVNSIYQSCLNE